MRFLGRTATQGRFCGKVYFGIKNKVPINVNELLIQYLIIIMTYPINPYIFNTSVSFQSQLTAIRSYYKLLEHVWLSKSRNRKIQSVLFYGKSNGA